MAELAEWERELFDPEYALVKAKERYEAAISVLDDLVRSHIDSGYRHAAQFVSDLERQGKAVAVELAYLQSQVHAVNVRKEF